VTQLRATPCRHHDAPTRSSASSPAGPQGDGDTEHRIAACGWNVSSRRSRDASNRSLTLPLSSAALTKRYDVVKKVLRTVKKMA
jgi:hypothetical protein